MIRKIFIVIMLLPISLMSANTTGVYNVKDYGAKGDGKALDHEAINIAIEAANKAGGGHTYFHNSLIWAEGQHDISITGRGMSDGEGLTKRDTEKAGNVQGGSIGTGDKAIALKQCRKNVDNRKL